MKNLTFTKLELVLKTWEAVRRMDNYHTVLGSRLYQKFFTRSLEGKMMFGWPADADPSSPEVLQSRAFIMQATQYVKMFDATINMLGPSVELLTQILEEMGEKHYRYYNVTSNLYPIMGECLMESLREVLRDDFTEEVELAWREIFYTMSQDMIVGEQAWKQQEELKRMKLKQLASASSLAIVDSANHDHTNHVISQRRDRTKM